MYFTDATWICAFVTLYYRTKLLTPGLVRTLVRRREVLNSDLRIAIPTVRRTPSTDFQSLPVQVLVQHCSTSKQKINGTILQLWFRY